MVRGAVAGFHNYNLWAAFVVDLVTPIVASQTIAATPPLLSLIKMDCRSPKTGLGRRVSQKKLASEAYYAMGAVAQNSIANRAIGGHYRNIQVGNQAIMITGINSLRIFYVMITDWETKTYKPKLQTSNSLREPFSLSLFLYLSSLSLSLFFLPLSLFLVALSLSLSLSFSLYFSVSRSLSLSL